ncbi:hypothetical protein Nmel_014275, partial [Mimus melanotis]
ARRFVCREARDWPRAGSLPAQCAVRAFRRDRCLSRLQCKKRCGARLSLSTSSPHPRSSSSGRCRRAPPRPVPAGRDAACGAGRGSARWTMAAWGGTREMITARGR